MLLTKQTTPSLVTVKPMQVNQGKAAHQKTDMRSVELRFAQQLAASPRFTQNGGVFYKWNNCHHEVIPRKDMKANAFAWLESNAPEQATASKADSCVDAALLKLRPLPKRDDSRIIIPLLNGYLEAMADGTFRWLDPSPSLGICHVLGISPPRLGEHYQPQQVPDGSLLAHYFSTSIPDADIRGFLQEMAGDTLVPNIRFQHAAVLKGEGRNGKSIFTRLVAALHPNVAYKRLDELSGFKLMDLVGASLAIADEVPRTGINEQAFKAIVSGETVSVDIKYQDPVAVEMSAKWIVCTNNDQRMSDNSFGFWRRVVIIPFDTTIAASDVIPELDKKIIADELGHFLDWCLIGLQRLTMRGAMPPLPVVLEQAKQQAVAASDPVAAWIAERFVTLANHPCYGKEEFYRKFLDWSYDQGYRSPPIAPLFWKAIKARFGKDLTESHPRVNGTRVRKVNLTFE